MFPVGAIMSDNTTSLSEEASCVSSFGTLNPLASNISPVDQQPQNIKKKRNLPGNPDPDAEVIALSPRTLLATNKFMCEICKKGFQRDQNLQLHRRGHNLPWKLKQRNNNKDVIKKKAYVCPEPSCVHHHPSRALGDLTGIKKHFCRKHGEKKWKCEKCAKIYAVQSDWKAHSRTCGTREYRCDCGTLFSRKDSFVTHRAFCDALAEESARLSAAAAATNAVPILMSSSSTATPPQPLSLQQQQQQQHHQPIFSLLNQHQQEEQKHDYFQNPPIHISLNTWDPPPPPPPQNPNPNPAILHHNNHIINIKAEAISNNIDLPISNSPFLFYPEPPPPSSSYKNFLMMTPPFHSPPPPPASSAAAHLLSATALLQKAATAGAQPAGHVPSGMSRMDLGGLGHVTAGIPADYQMGNFATWQQRNDHNRGPTRDFLGLTGDRGNGNGNVDVNVNVNVNGRNLLSFTRGVEFPTYVHPLLRTTTHVGFATQDQPPAATQTTWGN